MGREYLPATDPALLAWSANFSTKITATPTVYGLTAPLATSYASLQVAFASAMAAVDPSVRSKPLVAAKNAARTALKTQTRFLASLVQGTATVTDAQKLELGLTVRAMPSPIPAPTDPPMLEIVSRIGTNVRIKLHDGTGSRRGKPVNVQGARVYSHIGPTPPTDASGWFLQGQATNTIVDLQFASDTAPGTIVWLVACWYNPRGETGPGCSPVSTPIAGGATMLEAA